MTPTPREHDPHHRYAVDLYRLLDAGGTPPVLGHRPQLGPVLLDALVTYAWWGAIDVQITTTPLVVPLHPAAALAVALLARRQARRAAAHAEALAAPQWRDPRPALLALTPTATWCRLDHPGGRSGVWHAFAHTDLAGYHLDGDTAILLPHASAPRALTGPAAWAHAVLLAYLHPPTPDWREAPWLAPIRAAAEPGRRP